MSFPRYPKYKDSGVEWLGEVPEHWEVRRLSPISTKITNGYVGPTRDILRDDGVRYLQSLHIKGNRIRFDVPYFVSEEWSNEHSKSILDVGDVLIVQTGDIGQVAVVPKEFAGCNCHALIVLSPLRSIVDGEWIASVLNSDFGIHSLLSIQTGALHPHLNCGNVKDIAIPLPSKPEQGLVIAFLDRETTKIDALVREQRRLIELLKEKRQAVISHAVTKGLNPHAPMKPSGIDWLGDVPAHWVVTPLQRLTDPNRPVMYGIVLPGPDVGDGIPILKGGNVKPARMNLESMARTTPEIEVPYARARLNAGDLVYSIRGTIGDCEQVPPELDGSNITQDVARVAISGDVCASWARWALLSSAVRDDLACGSLGAAVRGVNIYDLKRAKLPTPPIAEQIGIATFLDAETARLDALTTEAERAIDLLQERRTALISAAVTGKIDVRGLAASEAA